MTRKVLGCSDTALVSSLLSSYPTILCMAHCTSVTRNEWPSTNLRISHDHCFLAAKDAKLLSSLFVLILHYGLYNVTKVVHTFLPAMEAMLRAAIKTETSCDIHHTSLQSSCHPSWSQRRRCFNSLDYLAEYLYRYMYIQGRRQLFRVGGANSQLINYSYTCACFQCMKVQLWPWWLILGDCVYDTVYVFVYFWKLLILLIC